MNLSTLHGLSHHIIRQRLEDIKFKIWLSDINNMVRSPGQQQDDSLVLEPTSQSY